MARRLESMNMNGIPSRQNGFVDVCEQVLHVGLVYVQLCMQMGFVYLCLSRGCREEPRVTYSTELYSFEIISL